MSDVAAALREILRRKAFYLAVIVGALLLAGMIAEAAMLRGATAVDAGLALDLHNDYVVKVLGTWNLGVALLAVYLGAAAASPRAAGARPVARPRSSPPPPQIGARWFAALIVAWTFALAGFAVALGIARFFDAPHTEMIWLAAAAAVASPVLLSAMSLTLSVIASPVLAGAVTLLVGVFMPPFVAALLDHPQPIIRALASMLYWLAPADLPYDMLNQSFNMELTAPAYALYGQVLAENLLYACILAAIAATVFARREQRAR